MDQHYQNPHQQWPVPPQPQPQQHYPQAPPLWNQPPLQQVPPQQIYSQPPPADEIRTLWIGDLQYYMDEAYLQSTFGQTGELVSVKIIKNKQTGQSEGYGFLEFVSRATAERVLQTFGASQAGQPFRVNWASHAGHKRDESPDYTIFVGDLAADVTDLVLQETFRGRYASVKGANIVIDRLTGRSKGYGFVKFGDESEQLRAMSEMNGTMCSTRPMRIGPAANKKATGALQQSSTRAATYQNDIENQSESDPNNTTIFVGGLDSNVNEDHLRQLFSSYGELVHIKIPFGKRCGFVQFANRSNAEEALLMLNGTPLGGQSIRLSWGRSPNKQEASGGWAQPQSDPSQWNGAAYYGGYGQGGYDGNYGYAQPPPQDPNMYGYGGYPGYNNPQQQQ